MSRTEPDQPDAYAAEIERFLTLECFRRSTEALHFFQDLGKFRRALAELGHPLKPALLDVLLLRNGADELRIRRKRAFAGGVLRM